MPDEVTLVGRLAGALGHAWLEVGGKRHVRDTGDPITLELDDGARVTVAVTPARLGIRAEPRRETWGELAATPLAKQFEDVAPGDHVEVELGGWTLAAGTRVAGRGTATERALVGGGPRDAASSQPTKLDARRLAVVDGDDAAAIAQVERVEPIVPPKPAPRPRAPSEPPPPKVPRPWGRFLWINLVIGVVALVIAAITWEPLSFQLRENHAPVGLLFAAPGALILLFAPIMWLSRPPFECAVSNWSRHEFHPTWAISKAYAAVVLTYLMLVLSALGPIVAVTGEPRWAMGLVAPIALTGIGFAIWLGVKTRRHLRFARLLLSGKGTFRGVVRSESDAPLDAEVSYQQRSKSYTYTHTNKDGSTSQRTGTKIWTVGCPKNPAMKPMRVESGDRTIELVGDEAWWGAPIAYRPIGGNSEMFCTRATIRPGDEVIVLGRIRDGQVKATGTESLILFGAPEGAARTLFTLTARWLGGYLLVLAAIGLSIAASIYLWTR